MRNRITLTLLFAFHLAQAQVPVPSTGAVRHFENFESKYTVPRNIDVWLPEGYTPKKKYAVLYMHDGKGLYDSAMMWNKQEWRVDEVLGGLLKENKIKDCLVVGIWNSEATRHHEYFPQKPYESLSQTQKDTITAHLQRLGRTKEIFTPKSDNYLKFLVEELKPFIDQNFSTKPEAPHTFIAGSSMGGLISLYAICEYPKVFGGAACLSTHWPGTFSVYENPIPPAFFRYMRNHLPSFKNHRLYFDYGNQTLDTLYPPLQAQADEIIREAGYTTNNWITQFFPGEDHSEKAWAKRLHIPILFLLKK
jgi:enterochelin esterase-like enzyme